MLAHLLTTHLLSSADNLFRLFPSFAIAALQRLAGLNFHQQRRKHLLPSDLLRKRGASHGFKSTGSALALDVQTRMGSIEGTEARRHCCGSDESFHPEHQRS